MKETLTCSMCDKTWKRDKSRGRKPTACPKCAKAVAKNKEDEKKQSVKRSVKAEPVEVIETIEVNSVNSAVDVRSKSEVSIYDVYKSIYPKPPDYQQFLESTKNGSEWFCKSCKKTLRSEVALTVPPTHRCPEKSSNIKEYERVS